MGSRKAYVLPPDDHAPAVARAHLRSAAARWDDEVLDTALLATSELVTNAVRHGAGEVTLVLCTTSDTTLRIEVHDCGDTPVEGLFARQQDVDAAAGSDVAASTLEDESGRGLSIVGALATRWGVSQGPHRPGVTVWLELSLAP